MTVAQRYVRMVALGVAEDACHRIANLLRATWEEGSDPWIIANRLDNQIVRALACEKRFQIVYREMPDLEEEQREREDRERDRHRGPQHPALWVRHTTDDEPDATASLPAVAATITLPPIEEEPLPELGTWRERRRWRKQGGGR